MKNILQYIYINKKPLSGIIILCLYFIDSIFDINRILCLADGWYYSATVLFFLIIGYTIRGEGFKTYKSELVKKEHQLVKDIKDAEKVIEQIEKIRNDYNDIE